MNRFVSKKIIIPVVALTFLFIGVSFKNDFFEIAKQIEIFTGVFKTVNQNYVDETNPGEMMDNAIKSMLKELDPYTTFFNEQDVLKFKINNTGEYTGIGAMVQRKDGKVFLKALYPMQSGVLEVKKPMDFLFDSYNVNGKIFQILLDRDVLDMKKLQEFKHQKVGKSEISVQAKVDIEFLEKIADLDFDKIIANKYLLTEQHFILVKPILNVEGKRVGIFVIGENIFKDNSLPKMTKKISTGLTTAALGLVVALLVLMI